MTLQDFLIKTLVDAIIVLAGAYLLSGVHVDGFGYAILVALALAILNQFVKPLLIIFTIPCYNSHTGVISTRNQRSNYYNGRLDRIRVSSRQLLVGCIIQPCVDLI